MAFKVFRSSDHRLDVWVDESSLSGEPKPVHKCATNPFLLAGCNVSRGSGMMLVTSVGMSTEWGRTIATLPVENPHTPLQQKLERMVRHSNSDKAFLTFLPGSFY